MIVQDYCIILKQLTKPHSIIVFLAVKTLNTTLD